MKAILNEYEFDVVLRIGGGKPHINKKKSKCRFISWVENLNQVETYFDNYNENDIIYTLYNSDKSLQSLNVKSLVPAASFSKGHSINFSQKINLEEFDISYIGNERFFDICDGKQNLIHEKAIDFFNNVNLICKFFDKFSDSLKIYFFGLVGPNKKYLEDNIKKQNFKFFGPIKNYNFFFKIFRNSKINLLNENNFLNFNTKFFFNILSSEGFLMLEKNKQKKLIKNLKNLGFVDNESFIIYDEQKDSKEFFDEYIDNRQKRLNVGKKGKEIIYKSHTYKHRAKQIVDDLLNP